MPLIRFDLIEGRDEKELKQLLDVSHRAVVKAFGVPERDRYQIVHQHRANELIIEDTGLGFERSRNVIVVTITSTQRSDQQKKTFYKLLAQGLAENCGTEPNDIMVSIVTNGAADWSFGFGEAQFLTGKL
ncbi:tautomerase family protein [Bacillus sp. ISL-40]|uniref:tautomerase family protein n=1 Tax=unclassified Bacillus (in: firmicutes) TaxID=185979 RepID=UPI001BE4EFBF|nr:MULTISPECIES: tautomerase family protein [unclassified Bacillus (in: firmicutes)]MBT2701081.1 tautomerase family protein [Bacillus sp. ISL-40]MBT2723341.1 tautomerase family protein [Bacillus sp. ISL-46]MBT2728669.1 tautomerase family protein [Bacillus sp. ISL-75]MBT2741047.1 tautomerase family protein [Bacillus sp. ISL-77]